MSAALRFVVRAARRAIVITALATVALSIPARAQQPAIPAAEPHPYDSLLAGYRSGAVEPAVAALTKLLEAEGGQRQATRWISRTRDLNRREDLEAALLLYTDAIMLAWQNDHPFPVAVVARYTSPFMGLRLALKRMDPKTPFLRSWYLLWESFRQAHVNQSFPSISTSSPTRWTRFRTIHRCCSPRDRDTNSRGGCRSRMPSGIRTVNRPRSGSS